MGIGDWGLGPGDVVKVVVRRNRKDLVLNVKLAGEN